MCLKGKCGGGGGDDISPCTLISSLSYDIILCALHSILYIYTTEIERTRGASRQRAGEQRGGKRKRAQEKAAL